MRDPGIQRDFLFSTVSPESGVPKDHPLRPIRKLVDAAVRRLDQDFNALYGDSGRDSIPPDKLLRAQLPMELCTTRSERRLMEQIDYNLLFRWFVGFSMDDAVWESFNFTRNRDRLRGGGVARRLFARVLGQADRAGLFANEDFSVDGTLTEAPASLDSYPPENEDGPPGGGNRNPGVDTHGEKRHRDTHASRTDHSALLFEKAQRSERKLAYPGHELMEKRHGLAVKAQVTQATGTAARDAADDMARALSGTRRVAMGADKNRDNHGCVNALRCANVTPDVAQNTSNRSSAIDGRTTCHPGYAAGQRFCKPIEEGFGWATTVLGLRKSRFVGREKVDFQFALTMAAYKLVRMRNLGVVRC